MHNILCYESIEVFPIVPTTDALLFSDSMLELLPEEKAKGDLVADELLQTLVMPNVCIVGDRIFAALTRSANGDVERDKVDVIIHGCDVSRAHTILNIIENRLRSKDFVASLGDTLLNRLHQPQGTTLRVTLTDKSIIYERIVRLSKEPDFESRDYQDRRPYQDISIFRVRVFLQVYRSISHFLHQVSTDCLGLGYNGEHILLTPRCMFALKAGYNTYNDDDHVDELLKYALRGMKVHIPNIDIENVRSEITTRKLREIHTDSLSVLIKLIVVNETPVVARGGYRFLKFPYKWHNLSEVLVYENMDKITALPLEIRRELIWLYMQCSEHFASFVNLQFLDAVFVDYRQTIIKAHLDSISEMNSLQVPFAVEYIGNLLRNQKVHSVTLEDLEPERLYPTWSPQTLEIKTRNGRLVKIRHNYQCDLRPIIPENINDILEKVTGWKLPRGEFSLAESTSPQLNPPDNNYFAVKPELPWEDPHDEVFSPCDESRRFVRIHRLFIPTQTQILPIVSDIMLYPNY